MNKISETWIEEPNGTKNDAWINLIYQHDKNGNYWAKAGIKFDGCVELAKAYNSPFPKNVDNQADYIHICDIDEMIKLLTLLKEAAIKHFGNGWPR